MAEVKNKEREKRNLELLKSKDYNTLIKENENLIKTIIKRFTYYYSDYDEIFNIGRIAIYDTALRYDESKGSFTTYVYGNIYWNIHKYITRSKSKIETVSIDNEIYDDDNIQYIDIFSTDPDDRDIPENHIIYTNILNSIETIKFTDTEKKVLHLLYNKKMGFYKIADELGISTQRVYRIRQNIIQKLAKKLINEGYEYKDLKLLL